MADIAHPQSPPGGSEKDGVPETPGSSVLEKSNTLRGRKKSYPVFYPNNREGDQIMQYLKGSSVDQDEIDAKFQAAYDRGYSEGGFSTDTSAGLNFVIKYDRGARRYHIVLRRGGGAYAA